jgi:hypothetical protein
MVSCNYISFVLDGKKYTAVEDPSDGYRSCMDRLIVGKGKLKNTFPDTQVLAVFATEAAYTTSASMLWFYAIDNAQIVLEVGTDNYDDYYPRFVGSFHPENLPVNCRKGEQDEAGDRAPETGRYPHPGLTPCQRG